jgi:lysophospholipase L1-like esterase
LAVTPPSTRPAPQRILLVGDSVAETIGSGFESGASRLGVHLRDDGVLGCGLVPVDRVRRGGLWQAMPEECAGEAARIDGRVKAYGPDVLLVLFSIWDVLDAELDGRVIPAGSEEADRRITDQLRRLADGAESHGASVVILTAPYNGRGRTAPQVKWDEDDPARVDHFNSVLRRFARDRPEIRIADLNSFTAPARAYTNSLLGVRLRYDGVHFTHAAGELAFAWLWPQLQRLPALRP